ncbi:YHS domain-containing protein [Sulfodiicoccus acidiphilus]|nr:YHS domain-containing protein [Sulfodiicoccus acidiphilus]
MKDPVCGEEVRSPKYKLTLDGRDYYFCSPMCMAEFKKNPWKYKQI